MFARVTRLLGLRRGSVPPGDRLQAGGHPSEPGPGGSRSPAKPAEEVPALSPLGSLDKKLNHRDSSLSPHYRLVVEPGSSVSPGPSSLFKYTG